MEELSAQEREHIRLLEEYRQEIRGKLSAKDESFFRDKLLAPASVVLLTALEIDVPTLLAEFRREVIRKLRLD